MTKQPSIPPSRCAGACLLALRAEEPRVLARMDAHIALTGLSSGGARQVGAQYGSGVHRIPPSFAGKRSQKEYVGPPISFASQPHYALVWSYLMCCCCKKQGQLGDNLLETPPDLTDWVSIERKPFCSDCLAHFTEEDWDWCSQPPILISARFAHFRRQIRDLISGGQKRGDFLPKFRP